MDKIWTIAVREYRAIVGAKAFLIALVLMPVLMFAGIAVQSLIKGRVGPQQKRIVVLDGTGVLLPKLQQAAAARNEHKIVDPEAKQKVLPRLEIDAGPPGPVTNETRLELSDRARRGEIDSFVEIPADVFQAVGPNGLPKVLFYAENAPLADERGWLAGVINDAVRSQRLKDAGIDPAVVKRADMPVLVEPERLSEKAQAGEAAAPKQASEMQAVLLPFGMMMLMWMVIFLAAQPMLESVMEEKSQRIAEVLLGSVNCFQLMLGKLLGGIGGSLTVLAVYGVGGYLVARHYDVADMVPLRVVPWFIVFQVLAVLLFGSIFMAIGAAVNQMKEAQGMLLPVWLVFMYPLFVWLQVVQEPNGSFATWLSLVPPGIPLMMVLRIAASRRGSLVAAAGRRSPSWWPSRWRWSRRRAASSASASSRRARPPRSWSWPAGPCGDDEESCNVPFWIFAIVLTVAVFMVYRPAWQGGLVWDDEKHVTPADLQSWEGLSRIWSDHRASAQYYPVVHTAFWIEHQLWGGAPLGYHLVNIALHCAAAPLAARVLLRLAVPAAPIWPRPSSHCTPCKWNRWPGSRNRRTRCRASSTSPPRWSTSALTARGKPAWYLAAAALFLMALASKTVTATLPAALLVVFWWQRGRLLWTKDVLPLLPFFVGACMGIVSAWVELASQQVRRPGVRLHPGRSGS